MNNPNQIPRPATPQEQSDLDLALKARLERPDIVEEIECNFQSRVGGLYLAGIVSQRFNLDHTYSTDSEVSVAVGMSEYDDAAMLHITLDADGEWSGALHDGDESQEYSPDTPRLSIVGFAAVTLVRHALRIARQGYETDPDGLNEQVIESLAEAVRPVLLDKADVFKRLTPYPRASEQLLPPTRELVAEIRAAVTASDPKYLEYNISNVKRLPDHGVNNTNGNRIYLFESGIVIRNQDGSLTREGERTISSTTYLKNRDTVTYGITYPVQGQPQVKFKIQSPFTHLFGPGVDLNKLRQDALKLEAQRDLLNTDISYFTDKLDSV